jgi:uncharacterized protein (TIGR02996 family)
MPRNPPAPRGGGSPWVYPPAPPIPWRDPLSADPTEHQLLAAVRATPSDDGARLVYADWLEQRGRALEAQFVRHAGTVAHRDPLAHAGDPAWRRLTSRGEIVRCERTECPGRWDLLAAEALDEKLRSCGRCLRVVRYVATADDATNAGGAQGCPIVIDAPADRDALERAYELAQVRSAGRSRPLPPA